MSKPEDVSQEAWDAARVLVPDYVRLSIVEGIARAIMAAKAEEREAVLQFEFDLPVRMYGADMMIEILEYIRKRGEG